MSRPNGNPFCECGNAKEPCTVSCANCKRLDRLARAMWHEHWQREWQEGQRG